MKSADLSHTVLLRSDGIAVACELKDDGQCNIPPLDAGLSYTQVSAGDNHTVLLRSDGIAVACGSYDLGQCSIPPLEGLSYTQVSVGDSHTVSASSKQWHCHSLWRQWCWTVQHSTFGPFGFMHSSVFGPHSHSSPSM